MCTSISEKEQRLRLNPAEPAAWIWLRSTAIAAAVAVAYFLAAQLSNSFLITPETVIFWPAAGISSGLLIALWSVARWPVLVGVMVATAAANLLRPFSVAVTATWVLGNTAEPLIIAGLVQCYFGAQFQNRSALSRPWAVRRGDRGDCRRFHVVDFCILRPIRQPERANRYLVALDSI